MTLFGIFFRFLFLLQLYSTLNFITAPFFFSSVAMTTAQVLISASSLAPNDVVKSNQKQETGNQKLKCLHYPENLATGKRRPKTKSEKHKNYCIRLKVKN